MEHLGFGFGPTPTIEYLGFRFSICEVLRAFYKRKVINNDGRSSILG